MSDSAWNLLTGLQPSHSMTTELLQDYSKPALYIITFDKVPTKVHIYRVLKNDQKKEQPFQSITHNVKRQIISADKTFDEGHDVIQYFLPVKYQCEDIYSNCTCTYTLFRVVL